MRACHEVHDSFSFPVFSGSSEGLMCVFELNCPLYFVYILGVPQCRSLGSGVSKIDKLVVS